MKTNEQVFHSGEIDVQKRVGVAERMAEFGKLVVRDHMPQQHQDFYQKLPYLFLGYADQNHDVWASVIASDTHFIDVPNDKSLIINNQPFLGDPLNQVLEHFQQNQEQVSLRLGLLGIELATRRRNRVSTQLTKVTADKMTLKVLQTLGNCPQYIQKRSFEHVPTTPSHKNIIAVDRFDENLSAFIEQADTFFVASSSKTNTAFNYDHASEGADVSHRGGKPGFIRVDNDKTLTIPDYSGNNHYNTLGNFEINPSAGLLFLDFKTGDIYTFTGTATTLWDHPDQQHFKGAERLWQFRLKKGFVLRNTLPLRFKLDEMSPNSLMTDSWHDAQQRRSLQENKNRWLNAKVTKTVSESQQIKSFYLALADNAIPKFQPGQFITLQITINGERYTRNYSVSSAPHDEFLRFSVKRDGLVSSWLHENIRENSNITLQLPKGAFYLDTQPQADKSPLRPAVLISAGVGITPMVSMFKHVVDENLRTRNPREILMVNSFRHENDVAFFDEIQNTSQKSDGFAKSLWLITQPENPKNMQPHRVAARLSEALIQQLLPLGRYDFYLCGPQKFMQETYDTLLNLGVRDSDIRAEAFGPASLQRNLEDESVNVSNPEPVNATQARVSFEKSQVEQQWTPDQGTLLTFAESHGLTPEFGCRNGSCGSCKVAIKQGRVNHENASFPVSENEALLCCAKPAGAAEEISSLVLHA